ncbi:hypothetical protein FHT77_001782 [Rhizobium sp. BK181]|nr:hypothetical protein [Rhizobium sp. BK181]MBB3315917.1 hypothetical protein [Rhizobium sp. BK181]
MWPPYRRADRGTISNEFSADSRRRVVNHFDRLWRSPTHKKVRSHLQHDEHPQPNNHQNGEVDVADVLDHGLHCRYVGHARGYRKAWMGMPFSEVIKTAEVIAMLLKESFQGLSVELWATLEVRAFATPRIDSNVYNPKSTLVVQLLSQQQASGFSSP